MKKMMKRWMAALLSLTLILGGAGYFADEKMDTVEAAETEEAVVDYGTYVWETLAYKSSDNAPICATEGYFFAGYYEDDKTTPVKEPEVGTTYQAKFVPADVLTVKCQTAKDVDTTGQTPADVRLITTVDSLNYGTVGFRLKTETKDEEFPLTGVLKKITADNGAGAYNYSANIFDLASKYYATATFTGISNHDKAFFVEPYWVTLDGTKVTGISRYMRISDSYAANPDNANGNGGELGYVNIPVYLNNDDSVKIGAGTTITIDRKKHSVHTGALENDGLKEHQYRDFDAGDIFAKEDITVTENGTQIIVTINSGVEEKAAKGLLVNLRLQRRFSYASNSSVQSRYLFPMTASDADIKVCDILQRNLLASGTADKSVMITGADSVAVITTIAEFKGMQAYLAGNAPYDGEIILLAADVDLNPTWTANSTAPTTTYAPGSWNFNATFDGQNHTIRGLYIDNAARGGAMFKNIGPNGTVKNFVLDNCYAAPTTTRGGLLGEVIQGVVENVEVKNSTIVAPDKSTGALCGDFYGTAKGITVTNCDISAKGSYTGGVCGYITSTGKLEDILIQNSRITDTGYFAAGICAQTDNANSSIKNAEVKECTISAVHAAGVVVTAALPISNVNVVDTTITGTTGNTAGIAGQTKNTIQNVKVQGGTITGRGNLGGIVGNALANAQIVTAYCDAAVTSTGTSPVGGIVGNANNVDNVTITDSWYAGTVSGNKSLGGIIGQANRSTVTISHCQNSGEVALTVDPSTPNVTTAIGGVGGIVGFIGADSSDSRTIRIEDTMNISKCTNKNDISPMLIGSIFGQSYGNKDTIVIDSTYGVSVFRDQDKPAAEANYASGWSHSCFNGSLNCSINGTSIESGKNNTTGFTTELDLLFNRASGVPTLDLSYDQGDGSDYWWVRSTDICISRLKSFADMPFKRNNTYQ